MDTHERHPLPHVRVGEVLYYQTDHGWQKLTDSAPIPVRPYDRTLVPIRPYTYYYWEDQALGILTDSDFVLSIRQLDTTGKIKG